MDANGKIDEFFKLKNVSNRLSRRYSNPYHISNDPIKIYVGGRSKKYRHKPGCKHGNKKKQKKTKKTKKNRKKLDHRM